jgi:hypothetical protein
MDASIAMVERSILVLSMACALHAIAGPSPAAILQRWNFEGADPLHDLKIEGEKPRIIADPADSSNHVMEAALLTTSERQERSEVRWDSIAFGSERWVSVRIRVHDQNPKMRCLFQVGPIKTPGDTAGRGWIQLQVPAQSTDWLGRIFLERVEQPPVRSPLGPVVFDRWETWVMHFRVADDANGFIEIWRGDKKVYEGKGPNARPRDLTPLKWGVYIGSGNRLQQDSWVLYDDIVLGDEHSSFEEVTGR